MNATNQGLFSPRELIVEHLPAQPWFVCLLYGVSQKGAQPPVASPRPLTMASVECTDFRAQRPLRSGPSPVADMGTAATPGRWKEGLGHKSSCPPSWAGAMGIRGRSSQGMNECTTSGQVFALRSRGGAVRDRTRKWMSPDLTCKQEAQSVSPLSSLAPYKALQSQGLCPRCSLLTARTDTGQTVHGA